MGSISSKLISIVINFNNIGYFFGKSLLDLLCKINSDGIVSVKPPAILTTSCQLNINNYLFENEKTCQMTWGR